MGTSRRRARSTLRIATTAEKSGADSPRRAGSHACDSLATGVAALAVLGARVLVLRRAPIMTVISM
eukprot:8828502-Pyramimonas_sp.AAC.1